MGVIAAELLIRRIEGRDKIEETRKVYAETHKGWTHSEYRGYTLSITENKGVSWRKTGRGGERRESRFLID